MSAENAGSRGDFENPLKKMLREGKYVIGTTVTVASAETAAHAAALGFDFLWIEMEHSPITLETLRNIVLATRGLKAVPIAARSRRRTLDRETRAGYGRAGCHLSVLQHAGVGEAGGGGVQVSSASAGAVRGRAWRRFAGRRRRVTTTLPITTSSW